MSIHCFMKMSKALNAEQLEQDLKDIIHRKFSDLLTIQSHTASNEICDWDIRFDDTHHFPVCLKTTEQIEFAHPNDFWSYWAQSVIEDELAIKYDAKMRDEDYPQEDFKPSPETHATFRKFLETAIHHSPDWKKAIIEIEIARLPVELKKF